MSSSNYSPVESTVPVTPQPYAFQHDLEKPVTSDSDHVHTAKAQKVTAVWQKDHAYGLNDLILDPFDHVQTVTTAGKSGLAVPQFNDLGAETLDGPDSLVWMDQGRTRESLDIHTLIGKTILSLETYQRGSVLVVHMRDTTNRDYFLKVSHNQAEIGGSQTWGTGVLQP